MKVAGRHFRTIWLKPEDSRVVQLIDQRMLPHRFVVEDVRTVEQMAVAIRDMHVRGAGPRTTRAIGCYADKPVRIMGG